MEKLVPFQLSQAHLQVLETCPRKFQYLFIDRLGWPSVAAQSEAQELGSQFHQLLQQQDLGLEILPLLEDNPQLQDWFERLRQFPPPLIEGRRQSECQYALPFEEFILVGVYDLLIQGTDRAQIVDWKTYRRPPRPEQLQQQWQSRLYPYILAECSDYQPEQISMLYWFAEPMQSETKSVHWYNLPYSATLHENTRHTLSKLLDKLRQELQGLTESSDFSQVAVLSECYGSGMDCPFVYHCEREKEEHLEDLEALLDFSTFTELSLD
ncbi:MAG TPA: PD-(D/E)XK nuclease family protein [Stenomitos sp.]